jgi:hypothetical protein
MTGDDATRMRLVELRAAHGPVRLVRFAPRITVLAGFGGDGTLAEWVAAAVAGPRTDGVEGIVEVAGRHMTLGDLPPTLLAPSESLAIREADLLAVHREEVGARIRRVGEHRCETVERLAQADTAQRAKAQRFAELEARMTELVPELEHATATAERLEAMTKLAARVEGALNRVDETAAAVRPFDPDAIALAEQWTQAESHWSQLVEIGPALPLDLANTRADAARRALDIAPDEQRAAAEAAMKLADEELDTARRAAVLPNPAELAARRADLRARAVEILGELPGDELAPQLRSFQPGAAEFAAAREALAGVLTDAAIATEPDDLRHSEGVARDWLSRNEAAQQAEGITLQEARVRADELAREHNDVEHRLRAAAPEVLASSAAVADLERDLVRLDTEAASLRGAADAKLADLPAADIESALDTVLAGFQSGRRAPGHMPVIVGVPALFNGAHCDRTLRLLESFVDQTQLVLVADQSAVATWVGEQGPGAAVFTPDSAQHAEVAERRRREEEARERREAEARAIREASAGSETTIDATEDAGDEVVDVTGDDAWLRNHVRTDT